MSAIAPSSSLQHQQQKSGEAEWTEIKKGWGYQRKRSLFISTQWNPRWLVLYSKPMLALAVYEQKSDARLPYTPLLHLDLNSIKIEEKSGSGGNSVKSFASSRCNSVSEHDRISLTDKLISRIDNVKQQLKNSKKQPSKQALEDHIMIIQKDTGERWTFGFESLEERSEWIQAIQEQKSQIALARQLEGMELSDSASPESRRESAAGHSISATSGLQAYGVTVISEHNMQALFSSTPPEFTDLQDPKLSIINVNESDKPNGNFDDLNQMYQILLSERRGRQHKGNKDAERVNDLSLLRIIGSFNQMIAQKVQEHIDHYHHEPNALDGLLFDLNNGLVQVELVALYEDGLHEREVAFANSVIRHELHSLQMVNEQRDTPVYTTLMSVLEYKGFRILAYWALPLSADTLMLREVEGDPAIVTDPALSVCKALAEHFGFMIDYPNRINGRPTCLHTGLEVHAIDPDLVALTGEQAARARLLPRGFYLTAMSDMLPHYSLDPTDPVPKRLRPEFCKSYRSDGGQTLPNADNYPEKTAAALKYLLGAVIDNLLRDLESLKILPVDSIEWTESLHSRGINISLLGELFKRSTLPHIKEHVLIEMVARAFKCILADQLRLAIRHFRQVQALKVEQELRSIVLEWIEQLLVQQRGRWIDELLIPVIEVKFRTHLEPEIFRQLPRNAGLLIADKEYDFKSFSPDDFLGFRVREVSSSFALQNLEALERDAALYNVGLLTMRMGSALLWRDLIFRAELARRIEKGGLVSSDQRLLTIAEHVAPVNHVAKGLIKLHQLSKFKQPLCSTSAARAALAEVTKASYEARKIAASHLGEHHPIIIIIRQAENDLLQRMVERLKIASTSKGNPLKEILIESLNCRRDALVTSIKVLGRSHPVTKDLIISIGDLQQRIENPDEAISSFQDALKILGKNDHSIERVKLFLNIARCYQKKGELDTALSFGQDARKCLEEREKEGTLSNEECCTIDSCYQLIADLALSIISNGEMPNLMNWEEQQVMSADMLKLVSVAADCYEQLYERVRSHPDRLEGEEVVKLLRRIIALKLCLARPAQKTLIKAARRLPAQPNDSSRAKDLILRMVTATSATLFADRVLDTAEQNPTASGLDELRLLIIIAAASP